MCVCNKRHKDTNKGKEQPQKAKGLAWRLGGQLEFPRKNASQLILLNTQERTRATKRGADFRSEDEVASRRFLARLHALTPTLTLSRPIQGPLRLFFCFRWLSP